MTKVLILCTRNLSRCKADWLLLKALIKMNSFQSTGKICLSLNICKLNTLINSVIFWKGIESGDWSPMKLLKFIHVDQFSKGLFEKAVNVPWSLCPKLPRLVLEGNWCWQEQFSSKGSQWDGPVILMPEIA